jgi:hypothetical protein
MNDNTIFTSKSRTVVVIGSCFAGSVVSQLCSNSSKFTVSWVQPHVRLDGLVDFLINDKSHFGVPDEFVRDMLLSFPPAKNKANRRQISRRIARRIRSHAQSHLLQTKENLKSADVVILDTNYLLSLQKWKLILGATSAHPILLTLVGMNSTYPTEALGDFDLSEIHALLDKFSSALLSLNSKVKIIVLQSPVTGFCKHMGFNSRLANRGRVLSEYLNEYIKPDYVISITPLVSIPDNLISTVGAYYFDDSVYASFARYVSQEVSLMRPSIFNPTPISYSSFLQSLSITEYGQPYKGLPERQFWKLAISDRSLFGIDEIYTKKFEISKTDKISTCGSCFAQHIARRLSARGFNYIDVEQAPVDIPVSLKIAHGYGIYSARYGNVYTSRQLLQLFDRAFGEVVFDECWESPTTKSTIRYYDPFRPNFPPEGYSTPDEMLSEQNKHLACVRQVFQHSNIFIFTMGLTETWRNRASGAVFPTAPGVTAGSFNNAIHEYHNFSYEEILSDMVTFIAKLKKVNPTIKLILTVSPVPLTATAENQHVLVSTMHSKSILRAVAGELTNRFEYVDYFPSYEIVAAHPFRGVFFKNNMRSVHDEGVDFVMSHFLKQHAQGDVIADYNCINNNEEFCDEVFVEINSKMRADYKGPTEQVL